MTQARIEAWQSYRQAWQKQGRGRLVRLADEEIKRIRANETDWRRRIFGGGQ